MISNRKNSAFPAKKVCWVILERLCGSPATEGTKDGPKKYIAGAAK